jgi:hypothetical protein
MRPVSHRYVLATLATALTLACSDSFGPQSALNGTWTGSASDGSATSISATLTLIESKGTISGSGNLSGTGGAAAITVTGTHTGANVSLTLSIAGFQPANFTGAVEVGGLRMNGTLNGSGFQNFVLTLTRPKR